MKRFHSLLVACIACLLWNFACQTVGGSSCSLMAEERSAVLEVFVRSDSERSQAARKFVEQTFYNRRGVTTVFRDVAESEKDLDRLWDLADHFRIPKPGLPAFYVCGRFWYGWDEKETPAQLQESLTVEVFVRTGCPRCEAAHPMLFNELASHYPGFRFIEQDIAQSPEARQRLQSLSERYRVQATSVPAVHLRGRLLVGFLDAATEFRRWDQLLREVTVPSPAEQKAQPTQPRKLSQLRYRRWNSVLTMQVPDGINSRKSGSKQIAGENNDYQKAAPPNPLPDTDAPPPRRIRTRALPEESGLVVPTEPEPHPASDVVTLPLLGEIHWRDWGLPLFTLLIGLLDGFNPCAMWVLLFLLSLLVNLHDRWKILAVAGTFVLVSGLAYLAFMAAWLNVFQIIGLLRLAQITLGLIGITIGAIHIKDFFAFKRGLSLSIPESAKPGLYERMRRIVLAETLWAAIAGASVLAVLVNVIELLCTAGLPAMYTEVLNLQDLSALTKYLYLLLYIVAYMFDDMVMVALVVTTLSHRKLQESGGRLLKLISGLVIFGIGLVMLFKPEWLV